MCEWNPSDASAKSPDRMDALVWAITELMLGESEMDGFLGYIRSQKPPVNEPRTASVKTTKGLPLENFRRG
jgi:hypothetical protein